MDEKRNIACKIIADHARAATFAIADGILPSNTGRNYVIRKIIRRAVYQGRQILKIDRNFFHLICEEVIKQMGDVYPELIKNEGLIIKTIIEEETRFTRTLEKNIKLLDKLDLTRKGWFNELATLYDAHGAPIDLMFIHLVERGVKLTDEQKFAKAVQRLVKKKQNATYSNSI